MIRNLPPSFLGASLATLFAGGYAIFDEGGLALWSMMERITVFGCALLILLTYSVSGLLLDQMLAAERVGRRPMELWMRGISQFFLGLAITAVGIYADLFLLFFFMFTVTRLLWLVSASAKVKPLRWLELANGFLLLLFTAVVAKLYYDAAAFQLSIAGVADAAVLNRQTDHFRAAGRDWILLLGLVAGAIVVNLILLLRAHTLLGRSDDPATTDETQ